MTWLTSKLTQAAALIGAVLFVVWRIFVAGKDAAENEQTKKNIEAVKDRNSIDADVQKADDAELDRRGSRWVRDGR